MRNMIALNPSTISGSVQFLLTQFAAGGFHGLVVHSALTLGVLLTFLALIKLITIFIRLSHHLREPICFLEITPPETTHIEPLATTTLFTLIAGILSGQSLWNKLTLKPSSISCEIISEKDTGIRFVLRIPKRLAPLIEKTIHSYSAGLKIRQVDDYYQEEIARGMVSKILSWKLTRPWPLPLSEPENLTHDDPLSYLTGNMSQLEPGELLALHGMTPVF